MVRDINLNELESEIQNKKMVVDFWAPWCGPCRMLAPVFESVSKEFSDVSFAKMDVQANPEVSNRLGISSIPCVIIFEKGQEINRLMGIQSEDGLKEKISESF